jgi:hypothetical protein
MTEERQSQYLRLIEQLMRCPNGQEPEVLDANADLLDAGLVQTMMILTNAIPAIPLSLPCLLQKLILT